MQHGITIQSKIKRVAKVAIEKKKKKKETGKKIEKKLGTSQQ